MKEEGRKKNGSGENKMSGRNIRVEEEEEEEEEEEDEWKKMFGQC